MQAQEFSSSFKALGSVGSGMGWIFLIFFSALSLNSIHPQYFVGLLKVMDVQSVTPGSWCLQLCFLSYLFMKVSVLCSEIIMWVFLKLLLFFLIVDLGSQWLWVVASPSAIITIIPMLNWCALGDILHFQEKHCNICWMLCELLFLSCLDLTI